MANEKSNNKYEKEKVDSKVDIILKRWHINPNLIMLKVTLFVMYGATASLLPYLTIHMQSIGLQMDDIAIVYLALPLTTFLSPPVTGYLIDKFGKYKPVVVLSLILNAIFHHSLLFIPHMETPGTMPAAYVMRHPGTGQVEVWWSPCPSRECPEEEELDMVLASCIDHCILKNEDFMKNATPSSTPIVKQNKPSHHGSKHTAANNKDCVCTDFDMGNTKGKTDLHFLFETGTKKPKRSRKMKKGPATGLGFGSQSPNDSLFFLLDMHPYLGDPTEQLGIDMPEPDENETISDFKQMFGEDLLKRAGVNVTALEEEDLRCGGLVLATNLTHNTLKELAADCMLQKCLFSAGGPERCPPDYKESDDRIFWIYFALRFMGTTMLSAGVTMLDPIALTMIQAYGGEFGRERLFSTVGMAIFSPLTGLLIDRDSKQKGYTDYSAAFYTYDILLAISAVTVMLMPLGDKVPADHILRNILRIIRLPHVIMFIIFLFILGNFWGFLESFLFIYLKELGASNILLGITVTVGTLSSMPFLYGAEKITKKFGHVNIIVLAFFSHAARLIGYSFIESPWWCFPFEAIESLAVHLMWVAAATYCALLAPKNLLATLIGVLGMAHFSLGRGSGSFIGGIMIGKFGTQESFAYMGILAMIVGLTYGLLHYFWLYKYEMKTKYCDGTEECQHLHCEAGKEASKRQRDIKMISAERLSLVIELNHRGSLSSLDLAARPELTKVQRDGTNIEIRNQRRGSTSKMDLLKSALELNHNRSIQSENISVKSENPESLKQNRSKSDVPPPLTFVVDETNLSDERETSARRYRRMKSSKFFAKLRGKIKTNKDDDARNSIDETDNMI